MPPRSASTHARAHGFQIVFTIAQSALDIFTIILEHERIPDVVSASARLTCEMALPPREEKADNRVEYFRIGIGGFRALMSSLKNLMGFNELIGIRRFARVSAI